MKNEKPFQLHQLHQIIKKDTLGCLFCYLENNRRQRDIYCCRFYRSGACWLALRDGMLLKILRLF